MGSYTGHCQSWWSWLIMVVTVSHAGCYHTLSPDHKFDVGHTLDLGCTLAVAAIFVVPVWPAQPATWWNFYYPTLFKGDTLPEWNCLVCFSYIALVPLLVNFGSTLDLYFYQLESFWIILFLYLVHLVTYGLRNPNAKVVSSCTEKKDGVEYTADLAMDGDASTCAKTCYQKGGWIRVTLPNNTLVNKIKIRGG